MENSEIFAPEEPFVMRVYRKNELAMMYFPDLGKESASRNLRRWINHCAPLAKELQQEGFDKHRKFYLRREVELIIKYLGLP